MQSIQEQNTRMLKAAQASLEAWINCENLLAELTLREAGYAQVLQKTVDQCAHICMETWQALRTQSNDAHKLSVLCIGICEECAEICEQYRDLWLRQCARSCRTCANKLADLSLQTVMLQ